MEKSLTIIIVAESDERAGMLTDELCRSGLLVRTERVASEVECGFEREMVGLYRERAAQGSDEAGAAVRLGGDFDV